MWEFGPTNLAEIMLTDIPLVVYTIGPSRYNVLLPSTLGGDVCSDDKLAPFFDTYALSTRDSSAII